MKEKIEKFHEKYRSVLLNTGVAVTITCFPVMYIGLRFELRFLQILGFVCVTLVMLGALLEPRKK